MHLKYLIVLILSVLLISCSKTKCPSDADWQTTAKPVYFTDKQKSRIPYRNINKITFLLNDTQTVVYTNSYHNDYFTLVCSSGETCKTCDTKNETENYIYVASGFQTINVMHELRPPSSGNGINILCVLDITLGYDSEPYPSDYLDSIPFMDSILINNKTYHNIHLITPDYYNSYTSKVYYDSVFYTKDFGIIKIIDRFKNKFELLKNE